MRTRMGRVAYRRGFTLTEILIAIAVFALVMALLGLPLFSAFGYVQKASARSDAQRAGTQAAAQLQHEIEIAAYIGDIPPDGAMLPLYKEQDADGERSRGMVLGLDSGQVTLVRYAQVPSFPWAWDYATPTATTQSWVTLAPNYQPVDAAGVKHPIYEEVYVPFHDSTRQGRPSNPYVVTRFEQSGMSWTDAMAKAEDARYPLVDEANDLYALAPTISQAAAQEQLLRRLKNRLTGVTPYGENWDAPRFQVKPRSIPRESLTMQKNGDGMVNPTAMVANYPLWAARSADIDEISEPMLSDIYGATTADVRSFFPLYPRGANPFGYQVQVFDDAGGMVYGARYDAANKVSTMVVKRHFMDWPRLGRPDWDPAKPLWTQPDIARQRLEGKLVFAQPMRTDLLTLKTTTVNPEAVLPLPDDPRYLNPADPNYGLLKWNDAGTYLVTPPRKLIISNGGVTKTFTYVRDAVRLGPGKFTCPYLGAFDATSRICEFGEPLADGDWAVVKPDGTPGATTYIICDLQPTDTVVVTYATKAVLDLALTVARKDYAARTPESSRQDFSVNMTIEARNAVKRARGED